MTDLSLQIANLHQAYRSGTLTPTDLVDIVFDRIEAYADPAVWISRLPREAVRERAAALDPTAMDSLPLFGVPFAIKDNIDLAGLPTTAACPDFAYSPAENATVVERLIAAGALPIGKTNLDQFATGLVGVRSPWGAPRCVFDDRYISGGSSSGSAVAVAAGLVSFALGTDTAGSGRVPAALNNIVGIKPSRGLLSAHGVVPACRSLDCVTIFAGNVADASLIRQAAEGVDPQDPYSRAGDQQPLFGSRFTFGVLRPADRHFFGDDDAARLYEQAIDGLVALGGEPVMFDYTPFRDAAALLYDGPWVAERLAAIEAFAATNAASIHPVVRQIILAGANITAVDEFKAAYRLEALRRQADQQWQTVDLICLPTCPTTYSIDAVEADPIALNSRLGTYTNFVNLLDCSAVAVPAGFRADGLPLGVSLIGPAFADDGLAEVAQRLHLLQQPRVGGTADPVLGDPPPARAANRIEVMVVGAHLSGMPLNRQLTELGARLVRQVKTAADYRLYALPGTNPPKPALLREPGFTGPGILGEVWAISAASYGRFVAQIPPPLGIGSIQLADGGFVQGFLGEAWAVRDAQDVTGFGGWRAYIDSTRA